MDDLDDDCIVELEELDQLDYSKNAPLKLERPDVLDSKTHKIIVPNQDKELVELYLTISHTEEGELLEMFLNLKDQAMYEWLIAITRLASKLMQYRVPVYEIVNELKGIGSTTTGHYIPESQGVYAKSVAARLGHTLEEHYEKYCLKKES